MSKSYTVHFTNSNGQPDRRTFNAGTVESVAGFLTLRTSSALVAIFAPGEWARVEATNAVAKPQPKGFCTAHEADEHGVMRQVLPNVRATHTDNLPVINM